MHETSGFLAITPVALTQAPEILKEYVEDWFTRRLIGGKEWWVACLVTKKPLAKHTGVAPKNVLLMDSELKEGVRRMRELLYAIEKFAAENPEECLYFSVDWVVEGSPVEFPRYGSGPGSRN